MGIIAKQLATKNAALHWSAMNGIKIPQQEMKRNSVELLAYIQDGGLKVEREPRFFRMACKQSNAVTGLPKALLLEIYVLKN